jgi:hypothetical protein
VPTVKNRKGVRRQSYRIFNKERYVDMGGSQSKTHEIKTAHALRVKGYKARLVKAGKWWVVFCSTTLRKKR